MILTLERPGTVVLTAPDQAWGSELEASFDTCMRFMGMILTDNDGIMQLTGQTLPSQTLATHHPRPRNNHSDP